MKKGKVAKMRRGYVNLQANTEISGVMSLRQYFDYDV